MLVRSDRKRGEAAARSLLLAGVLYVPASMSLGQGPTLPHEVSDKDVYAPTNIEEELEQIRPGVRIKRRFDEIAQKTNIRIGLAHTMLFQQASGGEGRRSGASGDLDILAKWTLIGAGTKDTGILAFSSEYRYQIGNMAPSALGGEIGTLVPTTNSFGERPIIVKEVYWDQRLFEDRFRYAVGRVDPENLFGSHRLQSANTFFLNKAFSGNVAVPYPGPGLTAAAQVKPTTWSFVTAGLTDANGKATIGNLEGFFEDDEFMIFIEGGLTPTFDGLGQGRYKLSLWHIDERDDANKPSDDGFTIAMDQDLGERLIAFARYGHADGETTSVTDSVQGGVGIKGVLGKENLLGLAAAWSKPKDEDDREEKVVEVFQRFQVTESAQFTVGVEVIFDPSNAPDDDVLGVFSARLRLSF
jgi:porin